MCAHTQALVHALATLAVLLERVRRVDRFHPLTGACCRVGAEREDGQEVVPPSVLNACVEAGFSRGPIVLIRAVLIRLGRGTAAKLPASVAVARVVQEEPPTAAQIAP
jgi:hypothetical protein